MRAATTTAIQETSTVTGPEPVVVQAGRLQAMKMTTSVVQGGTPVSKIYRYAPGPGMVRPATSTGAVKSYAELVACHVPGRVR